MTRLMLSAALVITVVACDSDEDGVGNFKEGRLGTDKHHVDSDRDGLTDGEELELGTSATNADSDGDGYFDGDEVSRDVDPLDDEDVIYQGGWPYFSDKDDLAEGTFTAVTKVGDPIPRLIGLDQYGDELDIYDFGGQDQFTLIDISAEWCGPCQYMAQWMDGVHDGSQMGLGRYAAVRNAVNDGDIYWVTVLAEDQYENAAGPASIDRWFTRFPHDKVPVMNQLNGDLRGPFQLRGYPAVYFVNDDMELIAKPSSNGDWSPALEAALQWLAQN